MGWDALFNIIDKLMPSRKAALVDQIKEMTVQYNDALINGEDTKAAELLKQLKALRQKAGFTDGDV